MIFQVDSSYDSATRVGAQFRIQKYVLPYFNKRPYLVKHLFGNSVTQTNFRNDAKNKEICYISGFDHGDYRIFYGHNKSILWDSEEEIQENEVQGKIIHLLSCRSGKTLGVELVNKGAKAFFGYSENFRFWTTDDFDGDPIDDPYADPFFKADSEIDRGLADGLTADEVHKKVVELYNELIDEWMGYDHPVADIIASRLNWDLDCLCSPTKNAKWGNKDAVIDDALRVFNFLAQRVLLEISRS